MRNIAHNLKRNALYHHNVKTMTLYRNPDYSTWCGDRATVRANLTDRPMQIYKRSPAQIQ